MSDPLRLNCYSSSDIPAVERLRELVTTKQHVVLQFPNSLGLKEKPRIIAELGTALRDCSVFDSGNAESTEYVTIIKVIDYDQVVQNLEPFVEAARTFRDTASLLCHQLATTQGIEAAELLKNRDRRKDPSGKLGDEWEYCYHGLQCRFRNTNTKQVVEVEISFGNEFGVLDPYFFGLFITSTPKFKRLGKLLPHLFHDTRRVLDILLELGYLTRIRNDLKSGLIAR